MKPRNFQANETNIRLLEKFRTTDKRQLLCFQLKRVRGFSPMEWRVLEYIASYSSYCVDQIDKMAYAMGRSRSCIERTLRSLELKGLIIKKYGVYKRLIIRVVDLKKQIDLFNSLKEGMNMGLQMLKKIVEKKRKFRRGGYTSPVTYSKLEEKQKIQESNFENEKSRIPFELRLMTQSIKTDEELARERDRQIMAFLQAQASGLLV